MKCIFRKKHAEAYLIAPMPQSHGQVKNVCSLPWNCMTACVDLKHV